MNKVTRLVACIMLGTTLLLGVPVATAGDLGYPVPGAGECPSTVIVAARGNDSKDMYTPTRYGAQSDFVSNGREGLNIRSFLHHAEARHQETHGDSLLKNTYVLGLTEEYYPADITIPMVEGSDDIISLIPQLGGLSSSIPGSLKNSLDVGVPGARTAIAAYETETGCTPQYILIGYSLGATILMPQEAWLAEEGRLAGTLYFGSVHQAPRDPAVIGAVNSPGGLLGWLPENSLSTAATPNRILYCIPDDIACDPTPAAVRRAMAETEDSPHTRYFLDPDAEAHSGEVADRFSAWINRTRSHLVR